MLFTCPRLCSRPLGRQRAAAAAMQHASTSIVSLLQPQPPRPKVIFVAGPTGVGKSDIAIAIAKKLNGEVISCDSVQIYRGLNIGSNKTLQTEGVAHHMIDVAAPNDAADFNAGRFYEACVACIENILQRRHTPILVGGTGMYMDFVLHGGTKAPPANAEMREKVAAICATDGSWEVSLARLATFDAAYAAGLGRNDWCRLQRALEIAMQTQKPLIRRTLHNGHFANDESPPPHPSSFVHHRGWDVRCFYVTADRFYLYRLIDWRCERMLQAGLIDEVHALQLGGQLPRQSSAGASIGYAQCADFLAALQGKAAAEDGGGGGGEEAHFCREAFPRFLAAFQAASRQYVRRQETWHRRDPLFVWVRRSVPFFGAPKFPDENSAQKAEEDDLQGDVAAIAAQICDAASLEAGQFYDEAANKLLAASHALRKNKADKRRMDRYVTQLLLFNDEARISALYSHIKSFLCDAESCVRTFATPSSRE